MMEELDEHSAPGKSGKKVVLVTVNDGGSRFPEGFTVEKDVVDGVKVTAVGTVETDRPKRTLLALRTE